MGDMLRAALGYAQRGWHVFPVHGVVRGQCTCGRQDCSSPGKHPLTLHGLKDASTESELITEWWSRWPAANIGIATGESGIVVIDIDLPLALASLDVVLHKLPTTLTALTGGGGLHLLYRGRFQQPLRNRTSSLPGIPDLAGIDLRADGGYIVAPPSLHISGERYSWLDEHQAIADAPEWLAETPRHKTPGAPPSPPRFSAGEGTAYGRAALDNALTSLRCAPVGQRNHTLNRVAFSLAQLVAGGELLESAARSALAAAALGMGLTQHEVCVTITSALDAGLRQPRVAPHRKRIVKGAPR